MNQRQADFLQSDVKRTIVVEFKAKIDGHEQPLYFANHAYVSQAADTPQYQPFDPYIIGDVISTRSMSELFIGQSSATIGKLNIELNEETQILIAPKTQLFGCEVIIRVGAESWALNDFLVVEIGVIDDVSPSREQVVISMRDNAIALEQPACKTFAANNQYKPIAVGSLFNVTPVLINASDHKYQFGSDLAVNISAVRFNGAVVPEQSYQIDLQNSILQFNVMPIGTVTCDVLANNGTLQAAIERLLIDINLTLDIDADIADIPVSDYIVDGTSIRQILDRLCVTASAFWFVIDTTLNVRHYGGTSALFENATIYNSNIVELSLIGTINPVAQLEIIYAINYTPLQNVADSVEPILVEQLRANGTRALYQQSINGNVSDVVETKLYSADLNYINSYATNKLALNSGPRYVYQIEVINAPVFQLGQQIKLEDPTPFGERGIITLITVNWTSGATKIEVVL